MPFLGAHMSTGGGLHLAFDRLEEVGGHAMQIFVKNQRQWRASTIEADAAALFQRRWEQSGKVPVAVHDTYLINLAASDPATLERSVAAFADELHRTEILDIPYLIMHPGSHVGRGVEAGIERFVHNLDRAIVLSESSSVMILIETTAGQGSQLGSSFEEVARILDTSSHRERLGVCYDTCHAFAAGYDIRTPESYKETFSRFDKIIGLDRLKFFHLNDSKKDPGLRVDRHEHIGKGKIGLEGFRLLLNDHRFRNHPMVLETPKGEDSQLDKENLGILRSLLHESVAGKEPKSLVDVGV